MEQRSVVSENVKGDQLGYKGPEEQIYRMLKGKFVNFNQSWTDFHNLGH